jgi:hypothetical protein
VQKEAQPCIQGEQAFTPRYSVTRTFYT